MASPRARGLFHKAIGESGAYFIEGVGGGLPLSRSPHRSSRAQTLAAALGAESLAALRGKTGDEVLKAAMKIQPWFSPNVDGYFLTEPVAATFAAGKQAKVPLLAGWNADEVRAGVVLGKQKPTAETFTADTQKRFGDSADAILKAYPGGTDAEALESAAALAGDSVHRLQHLALARSAPEVRRARVPLLVRSQDPGAVRPQGQRRRGNRARRRRAPRRRDRVRVRRARVVPAGRAVGAGRSRRSRTR